MGKNSKIERNKMKISPINYNQNRAKAQQSQPSFGARLIFINHEVPLLAKYKKRYFGMSISEESTLRRRFMRNPENLTVECDKKDLDLLWQRNLLVMQNLGLAFMHARQSKVHLPFTEKIMHACIGLIKAAEYYNPSKGTFSNYANDFMRNEISHANRETSRLIRPAASPFDEISGLKQMQSKLMQKLEREPSIEETAEELLRQEMLGTLKRKATPGETTENIMREYLTCTSKSKKEPTAEEVEKKLEGEMNRTLNRVELTINAAEPHLYSFDMPMEEGGSPLSEIIEDTNIGLPLEHLEHKDMETLIDQALGRLSKRDRTILCHRYGIKTDASLTIGEVGEKVGVSLNGTRYILDALFKELRKPGYKLNSLID